MGTKLDGVLPNFEDAACKGLTDLFYPPFSESVQHAEEREGRAKAICAKCPAKAECLDFALKTNQDMGIWGGQTERDRKGLGKRYRKTRDYDAEKRERMARRPTEAVEIPPREGVRRKWCSDCNVELPRAATSQHCDDCEPVEVTETVAD